MRAEVGGLLEALHGGKPVTMARTSGYKAGETYVRNVPKTSAGVPGFPGILKGQGMGGASLDGILEAVNQVPELHGKFDNVSDLLEGLKGAIARAQSPSSAAGESVSPGRVQAAMASVGGVAPGENWWGTFTKTGDHAMVPLAVDLRSPKTQLKPIYDRLMKEREIAGTLNGSKARAAVALDTLMNAPDFAPLSVVDGALSDLKGLARGADLPELRTAGQGVAAAAVKQLDQAVTAAARRGGREVYQALQGGRLATTAKYVAADVRDRLVGSSNPEPVRIFNKLIARDDTSVNLLRDLKTQAPDTVQNIGRAVVDQLIGEATEKGGFAKANTVANRWDALGDATKEILFPDAAHRTDLNNFFQLARRLADNPNPSGTAHTLLTASQGGLIFHEPITGTALQLGGAALAAIMHSPATSRLLLRGMVTPAVNRAAAASIIPGLLKAAGRDVMPIGVPAFASQQGGQPNK